MSEAPRSPRPGRRPRYRGSHPWRFEEKYKELDPAKYPEIAAHVRARGRTPAGAHVPIMVEEVLAALAPRAGERGVDATLGHGGHAERLLERLAPGGRLLGIDADPLELPRAEARLRALGHGERAFVARRTNFAGLAAVLAELGWVDGADFLLADLGVSSMQLDDGRRGFTFKRDGPLDMRMNPRRGASAAEWLARATAADLARALREHADEPRAEDLARILCAGAGRPATTAELARAVREAFGSRAGADEVEDSVRRVFQALRIAVNDELGALDALLRQLPGCLRPGGRVAFLTFHSGEDRRVKRCFLDGLDSGVWSRISERVVRAGAAEQRENPRSRSAKLRWATRR
jgi:16S rRNA (cytosine1402-N4)-methyltransferase